MNITPHINPTPVATVVNPQTDSLRRDNHMREVITQPPAVSQSASEKGVASEKERAKTPTQDNESIDFDNIRKRAEKEHNSINDSSSREEGEGADSERRESSSRDSNGEPQTDAEIAAEEAEIQQLKSRDQEVRAHELAHAAVGGSTTGAPKYEYEVGPDGRKYAVSGEVDVDLSKVPGDPVATIAKMRKVHAAALAPANPSAQDRKVAAQATQAILEAQTEILLAEKEDEESNNLYERNKDELDGRVEGKEEESFDSLIDRTLAAQGSTPTEQTLEMKQRTSVISSFYAEVTKAYDKPSSSQFLLTV